MEGRSTHWRTLTPAPKGRMSACRSLGSWGSGRPVGVITSHRLLVDNEPVAGTCYGLLCGSRPRWNPAGKSPELFS